MNRKLFRSESKKILGGVCGGLGEYLAIDPIFIRIFFIIWTVLGEASIFVYLILWVVMPTESAAGESLRKEDVGVRIRMMGQEIGEVARQPSPQLITFAGVGLVAWGIIQLLERLGLVWYRWDYMGYVWPALLIIAGGIVILRALKK